MELTLAKMRNDGEKEPEETTSRIWAELPVEEWGHLPKFTFLSPEFFLYKGNAGTKMEQRLEKKKKKGYSVTSHLGIHPMCTPKNLTYY